jgi:hypothetical protein
MVIKLSLAAVLLGMIAGVVGYFAVFRAEPEANPLDALVAESNGVTMRIVDIRYGATSTRVTLDLYHPYLDTSRTGRLFMPFSDNELYLEGFEPVDRIERRGGRAIDGVERLELRLGAVKDPDRSVVISIERICVLQVDEACEFRDGGWRFEWVPGPEAVDPRDVRIEVNQERSTDGIRISLSKVHVSSLEVLVTLSADASEYLSGGPFHRVDLAVRPIMTLPDGTSVGGEGGGGSPEDPASTFKTYRFPALPEDVHSFAISIEPFLTEQMRPLEFRFSLAGRVSAADLQSQTLTNVAIGEEITVEGETLRLTHAQVGQGLITLVVENFTPGQSSVLFGGRGSAMLMDANGLPHSSRSGSAGLGKLDGGLFRADSSSHSFANLDVSALGNLRLTTQTMGYVLHGPWRFEIRVP